MRIRIFWMVLTGLLIWPIWCVSWYLPKYRIGDLPTYWVVVCAAFIQALVVLFSAILAIDALPPLELEKRGSTYKRLFATFGSALFLATCSIGYLNDKTQTEAKLATVDATKTIFEIRQCQLDPTCAKSQVIVSLASDFLNRNPKPHQPKPTPAPQALSQAPPPLSTFSVPPGAPVGAIPLPYEPNSVPSLQRDLNSLSDRLMRIDSSERSSIAFEVHNVTGSQATSFQSSQEATKIIAIMTRRTDDYMNGYRAEVVTLRSRCLAILHLPVEEAKNDEAQFHQAEAAASTYPSKDMTFREAAGGPMRPHVLIVRDNHQYRLFPFLPKMCPNSRADLIGRQNSGSGEDRPCDL